MQDISFKYLVPVLALIWVVHSEKGVLIGDYTDGSGKKFKAVEECATDRAHWKDENGKCQSQAKTSRFHCLEANIKAYKFVKYIEICDEPILIKQGHYPIFNGSGIQSKECTAETFQDYDALSSETLFFKCLNDKTQVYSEGQLECGEVASTTEDRMFTCDYRRYYWFEDPDYRMTGNTKCYSGLTVDCTQVPEKQCSRDTHELDPDFKCVWKCKDEETRMDKLPYDCIRHNLSSVAPEETITYIPERSTTPDKNGVEPPDDHKMIPEIMCGIFVPVVAIIIVIIIVNLIVRCKRGENCPFVSWTEDAVLQPLTRENAENIPDSGDPEMTKLEAKAKEDSGDPEMTKLEAKAKEDSGDPEMTKLEAKAKEEHSFVLDYIGRNTTTDIIKRTVRSLGINDAEIKNTQGSYPNNKAEFNVQLLFLWYRKVGDHDHPFVLLAKALTDSDEKRLAQEPFSKKEFEYDKMSEIENKNLELRDIYKAASFITKYLSLVRFFGLSETKIDQIKTDHANNCEEQATSALRKCFESGFIKERKDLCDGLVYIGEKDAIKKLKKMWTDSRTTSL